MKWRNANDEEGVGDFMNDNAHYTNFIEIRVFGLQRSGNHAIINWILEQHKGCSGCFLNNVKHGDYDPYLTAKQSQSFRLKSADMNAARSERKHLLIYSYEDDRNQMQRDKAFLDSAMDENFDKNRFNYLGRSKHRFDILIIRDPFNLFASRIKRLETLTGNRNIESIRDDWKRIARYCLMNKQTPSKTFFVDYNRWFQSEEYRRELSVLLLGKFSDASLEVVSADGGGSSFDSQEYGRITPALIMKRWRKLLELNTYRQFNRYFRRLFAPGGQSMPVLRRWEFLKEDPRFRSVFVDEEMLVLSEAIFGPIPGTRDFVAQCASDR